MKMMPMSVSWYSETNALLRSRVTKTFLLGDCRMQRAEAVLRLLRGIASTMQGRRIKTSRIFSTGEERDWAKRMPLVDWLFGFQNGTIQGIFHIAGMTKVLRDKLIAVVRRAITRGPRGFRCSFSGHRGL